MLTAEAARLIRELGSRGFSVNVSADIVSLMEITGFKWGIPLKHFFSIIVEW